MSEPLLLKENCVKCVSTVLTDCQILKGNGLSDCTIGSFDKRVLDSLIAMRCWGAEQNSDSAARHVSIICLKAENHLL